MPSAGNSSKKAVWLYLIAAIVCLIGLGDAICLTIQDITGQSLRCTIISGCSEVPEQQVCSCRFDSAGAQSGRLPTLCFFSLAIPRGFWLCGFARPLLLLARQRHVSNDAFGCCICKRS